MKYNMNKKKTSKGLSKKQKLMLKQVRAELASMRLLQSQTANSHSKLIEKLHTNCTRLVGILRLQEYLLENQGKSLNLLDLKRKVCSPSSATRGSKKFPPNWGKVNGKKF